uniref:Uncharacterized protein n=1 Tax=Palpitomonas bilix TaxID=652834 RepID=A0A7S3FZF7_9EUKA|mmetsp:Transcript_16119/g.40771  ORF Transcript_16119/g.40771 Transcript_16119/m.40771 type:complete len:287 (+) Transcript_16119:348-1208(+)
MGLLLGVVLPMIALSLLSFTSSGVKAAENDVFQLCTSNPVQYVEGSSCPSYISYGYHIESYHLFELSVNYTPADGFTIIGAAGNVYVSVISPADSVCAFGVCSSPFQSGYAAYVGKGCVPSKVDCPGSSCMYGVDSSSSGNTARQIRVTFTSSGTYYIALDATPLFLLGVTNTSFPSCSYKLTKGYLEASTGGGSASCSPVTPLNGSEVLARMDNGLRFCNYGEDLTSLSLPFIGVGAIAGGLAVLGGLGIIVVHKKKKSCQRVQQRREYTAVHQNRRANSAYDDL